MTSYFFIVGAPRSGTTLLQQALNRHPRVAIPPETAYFTMLGLSRRGQRGHLRRLCADLDIDLPTPRGRVRGRAGRDLYEEVARRYLARLGKPGVTHLGEKSPEHQRRLDRIRCLFPEAKVLLIYRDGRDVALSLTRLAWMSPDLYVNFALWLHYYHIQRRALRAGPAGLYCVRYEALVADPRRELRGVLDFLGLPFEPGVAEGYGNRDGVPSWEDSYKGRARERISTSRVGLWREQLSEEQVGILERWGGGALRALGYDLVTDGARPLPWLFYPRVYGKAALWLARRPGYAAAKRSVLAGEAVRA